MPKRTFPYVIFARLMGLTATNKAARINNYVSGQLSVQSEESTLKIGSRVKITGVFQTDCEVEEWQKVISAKNPTEDSWVVSDIILLETRPSTYALARPS